MKTLVYILSKDGVKPATMKTFIAFLFVIFATPTPSRADNPYSEWVRKTAYNFYLLLAEYDADKNGCVDDPTDFKELLQTFITVKKGYKPHFESLCYKKHGTDDYEVSWQLNATPNRARWERIGKRFTTPDIWTVFIDTDKINVNGMPVPNFSLEREGGARITVRGTNTKVQVRGVGFNLTKAIVKRNIPESLLHFGIKKFEINDNGHFAVKVSAPLLAIPVKARGDYDKKKVGGLVISIFGFEFPMTR